MNGQRRSLEELESRARRLLRENEELRAAKQAAEVQLRDYQELFELAPDGYVTTDAGGVIKRANRAAYELLHAAADALIGSPLLEFVAEADQEAFRAELQRFRSGRRERIHDWKVRLRGGSDGTLQAALTVTALHAPDEQLIGMRWLLRDITERQRLQRALFDRENVLRRSEEHFRLLIENTSDIITILNEDGGIRYESPSLERILGYKPQELIDKNVMEFVHPEDRGVAVTALAVAFRQPGRGQSIEVRFRHRDGSWRILEVLGVRPDSAPETDWMVINSRDVTERKRAEAQAQQHQAELSYLLRLSTMGEMATGIAHELNQPLAAITNYAKGCARRIGGGRSEPAEIVPALEEIATQAMRAGDIIRRLRKFLRKSELRREAVDLNELVREVARLVEGEARERAVHVRLDLESQIPAVCVDAIQIEQVILNLVRNGLEAIGGPERDVREVLLRTSVAGVESIEVAVCDSGEGLRPDIAEKMFDPFFSTRTGALGMGLSISRSIVEAHGGQLWATANADHGTTFRFTLPPHHAREAQPNGARP